METAQVSFINTLIHAEGKATAFHERQIERDVDLDKMRDKLDATVTVDVRDKDGKVTGQEKIPLRESLRRDMTFNLVDRKGKKQEASFSEDGQEYAADSFHSTAKGHRLSDEDAKRVGKAYETALGLLEEMHAKKKLGSDGKPMLDDKGNAVPFYSDREFIDEVYTPMVREGLIPDNLVMDRYSATSELLRNTFARYKETLESVEKAKQEKRNQAVVDRTGANGRLAQGKALSGRAFEIKEDMENKLASKIGEANWRRLKLAGESAKSVYDFASENKDAIGDLVAPGMDKIKELIPKEALDFIQSAKEAVTDPLEQLAADPVRAFNEVKEKLIGEQVQRLRDLYNLVAEQATKIKDAAKSNEWVSKAGDKLQKLAEHIEKVKDLPAVSEVAGFYKEHQQTFSDVYDDVVDEMKEDLSDLKEQAQEFDEVLKEEAEVRKHAAAEKAARAAVHAIDQALTAAVQKAAAKAGVAMAGAYLASVNTNEVAAAAIAAPPDGAKIVGALTAGFPAAFAAVAPDEHTAAFEKVGTAVAASFRSKADGPKLAKELEEHPATAFNDLVEAAGAAAKKELNFDPGAAQGDAAEFAALVKSEEVANKMLGKGAIPDEGAVLEDLEKSEEELRAYQDQLILLDEGGMAAKDAASIEKMIADLKKERQTLELVASLGTALIGAGSAGASAGFKIADVATSAAAPTIVTGVLSAAKLIVKLAVNTKKAADRWVLWYKFRDSLSKAKKANSALTSTIRGFFNNKKEQIAFHTIEDALLAVQIAGTIVGSVPEPIAAAVGQSVVLAAQGASLANDIAGKVYNEAMLTRAWSTTVAAYKNPGDRVTGLQALQRNPTLGMHAIAWAGAQRQPPDPIARMLMGKLGINEKTIAAGATEDKVRDFLTELLNEDRVVLTTGLVALDWLPQNYALSAVDFFKIANRASRDAVPKLKKAGEDKVCAALKPLAKHDLIQMRKDARAGVLDPTELATRTKEAENAKKALQVYRPIDETNSTQEDMADVQTQFLTMAGAHIRELERLAEESETAQEKVQKAIEGMQAALDAIETQQDSADEQTLRRLSSDGSKCAKEVSKDGWVVSNPNVKTVLTQLLTATLELDKKLAAQPTS